MKFICDHCGEEFHCPPSKRPCGSAYCSRECYYAAISAQIKVNCQHCGKRMMVHKSKLESGGGKYCSVECKGAAQSKAQMTGGYKFCVMCGSPFYVKASRLDDALYCSSECRGLAQRNGDTFKCQGCGNAFYCRQSHIDQGRTAFCSRECQMESYKGEGNPNWRGGIDVRQKRRSRMEQLPATLTEEQWGWLLDYYDHCCAYCGRNEDDVGTLHREHVVPVSRGGGYTLKNIVPACGSCNSTKNARTPKEAGLTFWKPRPQFV